MTPPLGRCHNPFSRPLEPPNTALPRLGQPREGVLRWPLCPSQNPLVVTTQVNLSYSMEHSAGMERVLTIAAVTLAAKTVAVPALAAKLTRCEGEGRATGAFARPVTDVAPLSTIVLYATITVGVLQRQ